MSKPEKFFDLPSVGMGYILQDVNAEMNRSRRIHGAFTKDHDRAMVILCGEVGEVAKEVGNIGRVERLGPKYPGIKQDLRKELEQVMAVCAQWITNLDSEVNG